MGHVGFPQVVASLLAEKQLPMKKFRDREPCKDSTLSTASR
jgi:hypothetical protein